ncbi:hypothetical protein D5F01_LYC23042 [Larimichthys crocea]|uniref:Endonuclease domain-containing 1 protein n=1 Tax=Larimichthys crocea TaxID=215358 RepID=A0A6G0HK41_LARCR|nr:hypothetical protein D5F01_LYC23042 [Larimichthys crocea]
MTSLKTKNICFLAAFLFLAIVPTLAKVVQSASECKGYEPTPPEIPGILEGGVSKNNNRYRIICQTYNGVQRYLTVYDIENRIPVFSAYEYKGSEGDRPGVPWKIEPQLELGTNLGDNMMKEDSNINYNNQAVDKDYEKAEKKKGQKVIKYDRGHLFPANHASDQDELESTFTLTNAVPQDSNFNRGRWSQMEQCMKCIMDYFISAHNFKCFVVVGAKPGNTKLNDNNNIAKKKVNIPSMMWSAFRCGNGESGAYWDENIERDPPVPMERNTVQQLQDELVRIDPTLHGITVFPQINPGQKRSSSNSQQPQASKKSLPSSAGKP